MKKSTGFWVSPREPFRLFFLIGLGIAAFGLMPWPLVQLGSIHGWPGPLHALTMTQGFLAAFAVGFLGTMLPRRIGAPGDVSVDLAAVERAVLGVRPGHITFVAGLMVLIFATSVHVTLLHCGHEADAERSSPAVAAVALLLYVAAALRIGADWLGMYFLDGLTAAAALALNALLIWAVFLLRKLRRR